MNYKKIGGKVNLTSIANTPKYVKSEGELGQSSWILIFHGQGCLMQHPVLSIVECALSRHPKLFLGAKKSTGGQLEYSAQS